jgi:hypothetical protein
VANEDTTAPMAQPLSVAPRAFDIALRDFLSSIAPGLFLLLVICLHWPTRVRAESEIAGQPFRLLLAAVCIPSGFVMSTVSYFFLSWLIRNLESMLITKQVICGKFVTSNNWQRTLNHFGLLRSNSQSVLKFRYDCEWYLRRFRPAFYRPYEYVGGMEILSRNLALLALVSMCMSILGATISCSPWEVFYSFLAFVGFLLLSLLDSIYVGVHSVCDMYAISKYQLNRRNGASREQLFRSLFQQSVVDPTSHSSAEIEKMTKP